ncbi:MAG: hypothetical protein NT007_09880 [Candidatus Kapabacteria bacterium]|nr:hypothetical protein [Candidatus Kapabacteria bacterium]
MLIRLLSSDYKLETLCERMFKRVEISVPVLQSDKFFETTNKLTIPFVIIALLYFGIRIWIGC